MLNINNEITDTYKNYAKFLKMPAIAFSFAKRNMKRRYLCIITVTTIFCCNTICAQKIDSIYFHLYTDSLKKGTYNYINVDGYLGKNRYLPLTNKEITFSANTGKWDGNNLIIDSSYTKPSVVVTATLKANPILTKTITIYLKTLPDDEPLKTEEELLKEWNEKPKKRKH